MRPTTLFKRLTGFSTQVYEPLMHIGFSAVWFLALAGVLLIISGGTRPLLVNGDLLVGVATLFLVLFYLRVVDEIKDIDYDREYNPDRPLVSGLVTFKDLTLFLVGSAVLALGLNIVVLGWMFGIIIALDMLYGLFLVVLEKKIPQTADSMFVSLAVTYPVNIALSIYVFVFCHQAYNVELSFKTMVAMIVFIAAFLHHEIGRKTCWPHKVQVGKRHYSSEIGGPNSAWLATGIALFSTLGVFFLFSPWAGSGISVVSGFLILVPLVPAMFGVYTFFASEKKTGPDAPMTMFAMGFLFLFYLSIIVHTLAVTGIGFSTGGLLVILAGGSATLLGRWWRKDISIPGSIYIHSTEQYIQGNDMLITAQFKQPVHADKVYAAYEKMIWNHPILQSRWLFDEKKKRYAWTRFPEEDLFSLLEKEKHHILSGHPLDEIYAGYDPTNTRLPIRISLVNETQAVFSVNHVFTNGLNLMKWVEIFLSIYHDEPAGSVTEANVIGVLDRLKSYMSVVYAVLYMILFTKNNSKTYKEDTVDLSGGRSAVASSKGYSVKTFCLSEERTAEIVKHAGEMNNTVSEYMCAALSEALFETNQDKNRICISAPTDLLWCIPGATMETVGNYTGSLIFQVSRGDDLNRQVKDAFRYFSKRVPLGIAKMMTLFFSDHTKMGNHFLSQAQKPMKDRGPFEFYTFALSNIGVIRLPLMCKYLESCSGHTKNQTIFISMITLNGKLCVEVCLSNDLYDGEMVFGVVGGVLGI